MLTRGVHFLLHDFDIGEPQQQAGFEVAAQTAKLSIKLSKDSLAAGLAKFGLTNIDVTASPVTFTGLLVFAGALNQINVPAHYTKQGKIGSAK